jgi:hypothetical protein
MTDLKGASIRPEDMAEGGGLLSDVNVLLEKVEFVMTDYNGFLPNKSPALRIEMVAVEDGTREVGLWACGDAKNWAPSQDGRRLLPVGSATKLSRSSNFGILAASLADSGVYDNLDVPAGSDDIKVLEGITVHILRQPRPKQRGQAEDKVREVVVVTEFISGPDKGKGSGKSRKASSKTSGEAVAKFEAVVSEIIKKKGGSIRKQSLAGEILKLTSVDKNDRETFTRWVFDPMMLEASRPWAVKKDGDYEVVETK